MVCIFPYRGKKSDFSVIPIFIILEFVILTAVHDEMCCHSGISLTLIVIPGARCIFMVRVFSRGAMGRWIDPSW